MTGLSPQADSGARPLFEVALDELPRPVIISDYTTLLYANHHAAKMLRAGSREELEGLPSLSVLHPEMHSAVIERRGLFLEHGQLLSRVPVKLVALDGAIVTAIAEIRPVHYDDKVAAMFSYTITDRS